jgi:hypothetical protein
MEPESSLPNQKYLPSVPILSQLEPVLFLHPTSWRSILILSSHLRLGLLSCLFPTGFPTINLHTTLLFVIRTTFRTHFLLIDFIIWTIFIFYFISLLVSGSGPGGSVGIAISYGLDDPGIESRWGRDFSHTSRAALGPTQSPVQWVLGLPRGLKRPGRGAYHPPLLAPRSIMSRAIPLLPLWALSGLL